MYYASLLLWKYLANTTSIYNYYYLIFYLLICTGSSMAFIIKINHLIDDYFLDYFCYYIIPGIPPPIGGIGGLSSLISAITHSVVSNIPATEAAFSSATLTTFAGSITPAL